MTNEQYLIVSYFSAAGGGIAVAVLTALLLRSRLRGAVRSLVKPMGRIMRRLLPTWLILMVLFAFMSVSYLDCEHHDYQQVVEDRPHMVDVTHNQLKDMTTWLAVGLSVFALVLSVILIACPGDQKKETA